MATDIQPSSEITTIARMPLVAILCGGKGTRMRDAEVAVPKPLVEIGGRPILWHVMSIYASQGMRRFVLLLGHGAAEIRAFAEGLTEDWEVQLIDTGLDTSTGGRVARAAEALSSETFCLTYADGVADIDLGALLSFHRAHGAHATMTVVQPYNQWGVAHMTDSGLIEGFEEKPRLDSWINGGFFVMEPEALSEIGDEDVLERGPLERLAAKGQVYGFRHQGFWDCMDTYKDTLLLNELWENGRAPWRELLRT